MWRWGADGRNAVCPRSVAHFLYSESLKKKEEDFLDIQQDIFNVEIYAAISVIWWDGLFVCQNILYNRYLIQWSTGWAKCSACYESTLRNDTLWYVSAKLCIRFLFIFSSDKIFSLPSLAESSAFWDSPGPREKVVKYRMQKGTEEVEGAGGKSGNYPPPLPWRAG